FGLRRPFDLRCLGDKIMVHGPQKDHPEMPELCVNGAVLDACRSPLCSVSTAIGDSDGLTLDHAEPIPESLPCVLHGSDNRPALHVGAVAFPQVFYRCPARTRKLGVSSRCAAGRLFLVVGSKSITPSDISLIPCEAKFSPEPGKP